MDNSIQNALYFESLIPYTVVCVCACKAIRISDGHLEGSCHDPLAAFHSYAIKVNGRSLTEKVSFIVFSFFFEEIKFFGDLCLTLFLIEKIPF